MVYLQS